MKRLIILSFSIFVLLYVSAFADDIVLRTFTPFADMDPAAQGWEELLQSWQQETGYVAEDYSGVQDETWMQELNSALSDGTADIVILSPGMVDASAFVSAEELRKLGAANARSLPCMQEKDGSIILSPVRLGYETLFVNTDVLAAFGLKEPENWEDLLISSAFLSQISTTPIANSLTEWAEIVLDCCAVIAAPTEDFGSEVSLSGAREVLSDLVSVEAFGTDPWNIEDMVAAEDFLAGKAAMRFDSRDLLFSVPEERRDSVCVVNLRGRDGTQRTQLPGTVSCGLAVTRACVQDPARLSAVLSLVEHILSSEGLTILSGADGVLAESDTALQLSTDGVCGTLYDCNPEGFDDWVDMSVASLMTEVEE